MASARSPGKVRPFRPGAVIAALTGILVFSAVFAGAQEAPPEPPAPNRGPAGTDRNALYAREEFRLGVQSFNRYAFNEAILSFERALSYRPGEALILEWLGRAYYRSGLEEIAIRQWQTAAEAYGAGAPLSLILSGKAETVRNRRNAALRTDAAVRYVEAGSFPGRYDGITAFRQPSAVLPLEDGSAWVVAYGSNEIVQIDVNGIIRQRRRGPLNGFDRPYDLARGGDGRLFLSEYRGGRISVLSPAGEWLAYIGSRGIAPGQLMGPQNIALDEADYLYVVDYGNRRIAKFDPGGAFITSFGGREAGGFAGLLSPTGIAAREGRVFVADGGKIYAFDPDGLYLGEVIGAGLLRPEGLRFFPGGGLITTDGNRLLLVDVNTALITELGVAGNSRGRVLSAGLDRNGNILAVNFNTDEVLVMTPVDSLASGLFVQIDRVIADNFPLVTVEVQVQDRNRRPVVGLERRNFLLSEEGQAAAEQNFLYAGYRSAETDVAVLFERSPASRPFGDDMVQALRDISAASSRVVSVVSASETPFRDWSAAASSAPPIRADLEKAARGGAESYTARWRFDLALRLAATDLLPGAKKRAVVYVGTGRTGELAWDRYAMSELAAYLANNGIVFYAVLLGDSNHQDGSRQYEIDYLCRETGGSVMRLYRPEGIAPVLEALRVTPSGSYILNYRSLLPADFGRAYLPIEAEVYLLTRSGRDRTGYFPPLE
ncbi:MAG: NHL repeat-containing protein [Spirochaetaceae bacterium]|jgi:DNA-binding beta-propeller fold protein YncE|nr:NHL repeat-containing protein [Spirochaetaceae bacterium]